MVPIRVLIVDDAVVVRRLLSDIISKDRMLEVVGTAANGKIALDKIPILKPHVIVLDLEMPVMDGLQTLDELKRAKARDSCHCIQCNDSPRAKVYLRSARKGGGRLCHQAFISQERSFCL